MSNFGIGNLQRLIQSRPSLRFVYVTTWLIMGGNDEGGEMRSSCSVHVMQMKWPKRYGLKAISVTDNQPSFIAKTVASECPF